MPKKNKAEVLKALKKYPNIGPAIAEDLYLLGILDFADLKKKNPDALYAKLEKLAGMHVDRCMLYVLRALVYMAQHPGYSDHEVMWWRFKD